MCNLDIECFHNAKTPILLKVDGVPINLQTNNTKSATCLMLENGDHKITITKDSFILHWYWWLNILNLVYIFIHLKNMTKGNLGYDDDFASCTINFVVNNDKGASLKAELFLCEYDKGGKKGNYYEWGNIKGHNIKIKNVCVNEMKKALISRWRIAKGFPFIFYCILVYVIFAIKIANKELTFDVQTLIFLLASAAYSIFTVISVFRKKSVGTNLKNSHHR
ncbi:hypothetical protein EQM14_01890 [Caproiciproducens sp. NJN-50]|uniref:hypothetical protein n=1 Tax=Acutalibacteraceae TaxID=3082771 RepID=UPI000FFE0602|nr:MULTISPECIES: hypothetical protein [Acutalibacteraceae]QAT48631.1 hypothetical protein EQM14_01890 [Caproiciproducens sp. NJN-50]